MPDGSQIGAPSLDIAREFVALLTGSDDTTIRVRMIHDSKRGEAEEAEGAIKEPGRARERSPRIRT